jgi:hypothetical protein
MGDIDVTAIPGISSATQATINIVVGVAIAVAAIWKYFHKAPDPVLNPEVQVVGGALADRSAMQSLADSNDRLSEAVKEATLSLRRLAETRERTPESIDRLTQALERAVADYQRTVKIHGEDLGREIKKASEYLRSNL